MSNVKKSIFWAGIEQVGPQVVSFAISIILARLLTPKDYGLIGMIAVFSAFAQLFSDVGLSQALIQRKTNSADDEKSVFYINIALGIFITLILIAIAPLVAWFFNEPKLKSIMRVLALGYTLSSFGIIHYTLLTRQLDFKKTAIVSFFSTIGTGTVSITMAANGFGVWSLVGGALGGIITRVIALWSLSSWRPNGKFSTSSVKSIWKFSGNILAAGLFTTVVDNLANLLIGKSYSADNLGLYTRANQLQLLPISLITGVVNRVAFPFFSKNQDNLPVLHNHLRMSIKSSIFITTFVSVLLVITAENLIPFLFGNQWLGSVKYLKILSIAGIFYPINVLLITLIKSVGRSDLFFRVEIIKKIIIMIALLITSRISVEAMAWSLIFTGAAAYFFNSSFAIPLINYTWKQQFEDLLPSWIAIGTVGIITAYIFRNFSYPTDFIAILVLSSVYFLLIMATVFFFRKKYFSDVWSVGLNTLNSFRNKL